MFGFLKGKLDDIAAEAKKFGDKQTAEAIVAVMTGVAHADGMLEDGERKKITQAFATHPVLKIYDTKVLNAKFSELSVQFGLDTDLGLDACLKEIQDVARKASSDNRVAIMRLGVMAAKADGEIEPAESAFLVRAAEVLGVNARDFGL